MTIEQAMVLSAYTGIQTFIKGYESEFAKYEKLLSKRNISAKHDYDELYDSYDKNDLAVVECYTGVELLSEEDKRYLDKYKNRPPRYLREKMLLIKVDSSTVVRENKALSIVESIFMVIIILSIIAVIAVDIIYAIGYFTDKFNIMDIAITVTILGSIGIFAEMGLMALITKHMEDKQ